MTVFLIFAALITNIILAASIIIMALYGAPVSALVAGASLALVSAIVPVAVDGIKRLRRNSRQSLPEVKDPVPKDMVTMDKALYERCCAYMESKRPFLVESLTLGDLANAMFTNTLYLSRTINACSGKNFRRYVNDYRVEYAMMIFRNNTSLKIAQLSVMSGFHTVVTFNMAFKLVKGVAPSVWCQSVRFGESKAARGKAATT
ncbi:MAG: AraC family transcriptional regulator [Bacteroidales bacterium]|nr:AraC family transcriptional regulator [Bacteroidales bacterium]